MTSFETVWFHPTPRVVIGNPEGEGVSIAKIFKGKYEAKLEFPEWFGGFKLKNHLRGWYGYFVEPHIHTAETNTPLWGDKLK